MRHLPPTALLILLLAGCAGLGPAGPGDELAAASAEKTEPVDQARFDMTIERGTAGREKATMKLTLWMDAERGSYRMRGVIETAPGAGGGPAGGELHLILTADGATSWETRGGEVIRAARDADRATQRGRPALLADLGALVLFSDAAFGYPNLRRKTRLVPAEQPPTGENDLLWVQVRARPGRRSQYFDLLAPVRRDPAVWIGFSAKHGWPMKHVARSDAAEFVARVEQIDLAPDLTDIFEIPGDVRATLEQPEPTEEER